MKKNILGIICTILVIAFSSSCINANAANTNVNAKNSWNYEIDYSGRIRAYVDSYNAVDFDPPSDYDGASELVIMVSNSKNYGYDVIIGDYYWHFFYDKLNKTNYVRVSFDNGTPIKFLINLAGDSSEKSLYLKNPKKFVELAKKAKTIKVEAYFFDKSWRAFMFNTEKPLEL